MVTACTSDPLVPVTVIAADPAFVCFLVARVSVDVPAEAMVPGLKLEVTNFGRAPVESATVPLNPDAGVIVTV